MFIKIVLLLEESPNKTSLGPIKLEHDVGGPFPHFASLEAIPKLVLKPRLGNGIKRNVCSLFITITLCEINQKKVVAFP